MMEYLSVKSQQHKSQLDRSYIESVFESYSSEAKTPNPNIPPGEDTRVLTRTNAALAYDEIFRLWKVELEPAQEKKFRSENFEQMFSKFAGDDNLMDLKDAYRFVQDLMTTPASKSKQALVQEEGESAEAEQLQMQE